VNKIFKKMSLAKRIVPLLDRILIAKHKPITQTASGIFIPEKAAETLNRGTVLAVGPGDEKLKVTLKPGDKVILPSFGGTAIKLEGGNTGTSAKGEEEELFLYREGEILAKVNEN
jgi:chaperonin GroES